MDHGPSRFPKIDFRADRNGFLYIPPTNEIFMTFNHDNAYNPLDILIRQPSTSSTTTSTSRTPARPGDSSSLDETEILEAQLKYVNQMLMEENMEELPSTSVNPFDLQATEQSFYDVLGNRHRPLSPDHHPLPPCNLDFNSSNHLQAAYNDHNNSSPSSGHAPFWSNYNFHSASLHNGSAAFPALVEVPSVPEAFSVNDSVLLFKKGLEEANKFLPAGNQLTVDLNGTRSKHVVNNTKKGTGSLFSEGQRGRRKNYEREDIGHEEEGRRSNKQSAVYVEDDEVNDMLDKLLLSDVVENMPRQSTENEPQQNGVSNSTSLPNTLPLESSKGGKKIKKNKGEKKEKMVDLRTLLTLCAQAVSCYDHGTANELLKEIRQHSSPSGNSTQRLAHYFANALEARLTGTIVQVQSFYNHLVSKRVSTVEKLRMYQFHLSAFPFRRFSSIFANKMILDASQKAEALHIIDFGLIYGFQWPILIQQLSTQPGGPPRLRITGIDLPQPGLQPNERLDAAGNQLAKYCERFNVPFQFNGIPSAKWETIRIEELKIDHGNEVVAVSCMYQFINLLDETVEANSPRNAVLTLIRKMNPNIFVHSIINGSYDSPFFPTRFKETLLHFSAFFDMYDSVVLPENEVRQMIERDFFGRMILNTVACEGSDRIERPETYRQWQIRTIKARFRQLPVKRELMTKFRAMLKTFPKDFGVDEHRDWVLHAWKGRTTHASSCWVPM